MNLEQANRRLCMRLALIALGMFGFCFALVPFYGQICAALGVNSLTPRDSVSNTQIDASRTVTIELDSNTRDLPWRFRPLVNHLQVHPGELATVEYEIVNQRAAPVTFVVDPKLPRDVNTITVSYTFFEVAGRGGKS